MSNRREDLLKLELLEMSFTSGYLLGHWLAAKKPERLEFHEPLNSYDKILSADFVEMVCDVEQECRDTLKWLIYTRNELIEKVERGELAGIATEALEDFWFIDPSLLDRINQWTNNSELRARHLDSNDMAGSIPTGLHGWHN